MRFGRAHNRTLCYTKRRSAALCASLAPRGTWPRIAQQSPQNAAYPIRNPIIQCQDPPRPKERDYLEGSGGSQDGKNTLNVRAWSCVGCHSTLDHDFSDATNLMLYASEAAGHVDSLNACGGSIRLRLAGAFSREGGVHRSHRETGAVGIPVL